MTRFPRKLRGHCNNNDPGSTRLGVGHFPGNCDRSLEKMETEFAGTPFSFIFIASKDYDRKS